MPLSWYCMMEFDIPDHIHKLGQNIQKFVVFTKTKLETDSGDDPLYNTLQVDLRRQTGKSMNEYEQIKSWDNVTKIRFVQNKDKSYCMELYDILHQQIKYPALKYDDNKRPENMIRFKNDKCNDETNSYYWNEWLNWNFTGNNEKTIFTANGLSSEDIQMIRNWHCAICHEGIQSDSVLVSAHNNHPVAVNIDGKDEEHFRQHLFHKHCLLKWKDKYKNNTCPSCRQELDIKSFFERWTQGKMILQARMGVNLYLTQNP
jgi:hypothetical protein